MSSPTPPNRQKLTLGPGTLTFDAPAGGGVLLDISCQVSDVLISAEGDSEDPTPVLCGGSVAGARTYSWKLAVTAFQDILADGIIDWTWKNAGVETGFTFVPDTTSTAAKVVGRCVVDPVSLGGKVSQRNTSDFEWVLAGAPTFTPSDEASIEDTTPAG